MPRMEETAVPAETLSETAEERLRTATSAMLAGVVLIAAPVLLLVFGLGVALVEKGGWGWSHFWIDFALAGWGLTATLGIAFIGPELGRIGALAAAVGPDSPEVG